VRFFSVVSEAMAKLLKPLARKIDGKIKNQCVHTMLNILLGDIVEALLIFLLLRKKLTWILCTGGWPEAVLLWFCLSRFGLCSISDGTFG